MKSTSDRGKNTVQRAEPGGSRGLKELEEKQSDSCAESSWGKAMTSSGTLSRPWIGDCFFTSINNVKPLKGIKMSDIIQFVFLKLFLV